MAPAPAGAHEPHVCPPGLNDIHQRCRNILTRQKSSRCPFRNSGGSEDTGEGVGVDPDLIVKPFSRKGAMCSVREFTVNAMNQHHGVPPVERFSLDTDPDQDRIAN
jgi:hypothetical protein